MPDQLFNLTLHNHLVPFKCFPVWCFFFLLWLSRTVINLLKSHTPLNKGSSSASVVLRRSFNIQGTFPCTL